MSQRIFGRVVSQLIDDAGHKTGLPGLRVSVHSPGGLFGFELGAGMSAGEGVFEFAYRRDGREGRDFPADDFRQLEIVVHDGVGRELKRAGPFRDVDTDIFSARDIEIDDNDARGWLVTLGTGAHRAGANTLPGWGLSEGNRIVWLMDHEAFRRAVELFVSARESILMSQLFFSVPQSFNADATKEDTKLVFDFNPPLPDPAALPRKLDPLDKRPERLLVDAAARRVPVRVVLHAFEVPLFVKIALGALVFPFAGSDGVRSVVKGLLDDDLTDADEGQRYFGEAQQPRIEVRAFEQRVASAGVMHAKLVVADGSHSLSIGSPFGQSYVDGFDHRIDEPLRGSATGLPKHDAGFGVTGPASRLLHDTLRLLWDTADPAQKLPEVEPPQFPPVRAPELPERIDGVASMQIVRTLTPDRFEGFDAGETGILEGYLRAINEAEQFIYLETQYFTNDAIGEALVKAMKRRPALQTIVLLNIAPDVPFYPFKQRRLITRIREAIAQAKNADGQPTRFGVFTRWTHDAGGARPRILPVYVHAKAGIVDNRWATVGSANLDGLSLDAYLLSDILNRTLGSIVGRKLFRDQRAVEVNANVLDGIAGQPASGVVDVLRRKLWAEHLGFFKPDRSLDLPAPQLNNIHVDGWLGLWNQRAAATLKQLRDKPSVPTTGMACVLPWPDEDETFKTPRKHIEALGIKSFKVAPLKSTRAFDFKTGDWKTGSIAEMDFD